MPFLLPPVKHTSSEGLNIAEILFFLCVLQQLLFTVPVEGSPEGDSLAEGDNPEEDNLAVGDSPAGGILVAGSPEEDSLVEDSLAGEDNPEEDSPEADRPEEAEQRIRRRTT
mgnify:CR=1 FL=1